MNPVVVHLPSALAYLADGRDEVSLPGNPERVGDALESLFSLHPGVRHRVVTEQGEVRLHVNVFVGAESIRYSGGLETPVPPGAEIYIIPAVSGG